MKNFAFFENNKKFKNYWNKITWEINDKNSANRIDIWGDLNASSLRWNGANVPVCDFEELIDKDCVGRRLNEKICGWIRFTGNFFWLFFIEFNFNLKGEN